MIVDIERKTSSNEIEEGIRKKYWRAGASPFEKKSIFRSTSILEELISRPTSLGYDRPPPPPHARPAFPSTTTTTISELINSGHNDVYGTAGRDDRLTTGVETEHQSPRTTEQLLLTRRRRCYIEEI